MSVSTTFRRGEHRAHRSADLRAEVAQALAEHVDGCPLAKPWLYNLDEWPLECRCADLEADAPQGSPPAVDGL